MTTHLATRNAAVFSSIQVKLNDTGIIMLDRMIVDADFCVKLGGSDKYPFLAEVLPLIASEVYMHSHAFGECERDFRSGNLAGIMHILT